eukprot:Platyproteum_vivax@DN5826_c0_g1_i2.p2
MPSLTNLDISECGLAVKEGAAAINRLLNKTELLSALTIDGNGVTNVGLPQLVQELPQLTTLGLTRIGLAGDLGVAELKRLIVRYPSLQTVSVGGCSMARESLDEVIEDHRVQRRQVKIKWG